MNGFLNLNKPPNFTSHDCVAKLRKILNTKKIGHGGTLDPSATGVLPIAIGKATRLLQFLPTLKAYRGTIRFGVVTTTDDLEGDIINRNSANHLTLEMIESHLNEFVGKIQQIPPIFSAIKKEGKKLYQLARQGQKIDVPPRQVEITKLQILAYRQGEYPELDVEIYCSEGTYIRSIARDWGQKVGTGATLASLTRTLSCGMSIDRSLTFDQISIQKENRQLKLIKLDQPLQNLPQIILNETESQRWCYGQKIIYKENLTDGFYRTYNHREEFMGITETYCLEQIRLIKTKVKTMTE